jgi:hypothetical protein
LAKGTVTKRLAKAREELAARLRRRGITLGAGALSAMVATRARASVPAPLLLETAKQAVAFSTRQVGGSVTAKALAEGVMRSLRFGVLRVWFVVGLLALTLTGGGLILAGGPADVGEKKAGGPQAEADTKPESAKPGTMWKENYTVEYPGSLPVSVAFSADGKTLLTGDTSGEVMALLFTRDEPQWRWKSKADGSHAAVAYSADQKHVYATTAHGVRILDAATGQDVARLDAPDSNPVAIGVFPKRAVAEKFTQLQIVFGNARGYFVKSWAEGGPPADTVGTIETSTVAKGAKPADVAAVPLAVDPKGRSAIMTGPRDATGQVAGMKGKNVLWAYVCGDYSEDSPGNRVLVGHTATVVSAAWSKGGTTAVTGDADGRVIVWDAKAMKETGRVELGGRVMAVAISDDGTHTAAYVRGKQGAAVHVWETAKPTNATRPIHTEPGDFGSEPYASLTFSPDGKRLAGCAIDKKSLQLGPKTPPRGKVRVWDLAAEPRAQAAPGHLYTKQLPKGSTSNLVVLDNHSILLPAAEEGALDFRRVWDGEIQGRIVLGNFAVGKRPGPAVSPLANHGRPSGAVSEGCGNSEGGPKEGAALAAVSRYAPSPALSLPPPGLWIPGTVMRTVTSAAVWPLSSPPPAWYDAVALPPAPARGRPMLLTFLAAALAAAEAPENVSLVGAVQDAAGRPLAHATVFIRTAGPRKGVGVL